MAGFVRFYTVAFENGHKEIVDRSVLDFLDRIQSFMSSNKAATVRKINDKKIRMFSASIDIFTMPHARTIPFGKLKEKDIPSCEDPMDNTKLANLDVELFDVNTLAYDADNNMAVITTNRIGPNEEDIENYLNSYLDRTGDCFIRITPVKYNAGIERVRHAKQVRNVQFVLNLTSSLADLYNSQTAHDTGAANFFSQFISGTKRNLDAKSLIITAGVGQGTKKDGTLDMEGLLSLIDSLNIDSSCIKEIVVNYKNGPSDKVEPAKLKKYSLILQSKEIIRGSQVSFEVLRTNLQELMSANSIHFRTQRNIYFSNIVRDVDGYDLVEQWEGEIVCV